MSSFWLSTNSDVQQNIINRLKGRKSKPLMLQKELFQWISEQFPEEGIYLFSVPESPLPGTFCWRVWRRWR